MIYRIDMKHFLLHAIDHFSLYDLTNMQYCIISAKVTNGGKCKNVIKLQELYPTTEMTFTYEETKDKKLFEKMYLDMLDPKDSKSEVTPYAAIIYQAFVNPLLQRFNVMIVCDELENFIIDVLCKYLKKEYSIEVIDLNELFTEGRVGSIYIDRNEIKDKAVDIRRAALRDEVRSLSSTKDGKAKLIAKMSKKKKLKELKKFGVNADSSDNLDSMLLEEWCRADGQWEDD